MKRREFVWLGGATLFSGYMGCKARVRSRTESLEALVLEVVVPQLHDVASQSDKLDAAAASFCKTPTDSQLEGLRNQFGTTLLAWKRAQCFQSGPLVTSNALLRSTFWPTRVPVVQAMLDATGPIDDAAVEALGADAKGLYAIESLLFATAGGASAVSSSMDARGERSRVLTASLTRNLAGNAARVQSLMGDGKQFATSFAQAGQASINAVVGHLSMTIESLSVHQLELVLGLSQSHMLRPSEVEAAPSGLSHAVTLASAEGARALFGGSKQPGVSEMVSAAAAPIAERVAQQFDAALNALGKLDQPLERLVVSNRAAVESAAQRVKELERGIKIDVASALGVTLTFQSGDAD
ncbi:MAG TPA: imelysin family protein [Polyangiaceae bacterium]|jgi:hypothetical protein|nr:imelysin family protein [Polyangiaceae bacterium]